MFLMTIKIVRWEGGEQYCELESNRFQKYCCRSLLILSHVFLSETSKPAPPSSCQGHLSHSDLPIKRHFRLAVADFEVHQNVAEPAFNSHDGKGAQRQRSRPQEPSLTLPLTYSIMLCSKCKHRWDQKLSKNSQQVHILPGTQAQQLLDERVTHHIPPWIIHSALCSPKSRWFAALRKPALGTLLKTINYGIRAFKHFTKLPSLPAHVHPLDLSGKWKLTEEKTASVRRLAELYTGPPLQWRRCLPQQYTSPLPGAVSAGIQNGPALDMPSEAVLQHGLCKTRLSPSPIIELFTFIPRRLGKHHNLHVPRSASQSSCSEA